MHLHDLLDAVDLLELTGDSQVDVSDIVHDSRRATRGALFCCIRGAVADGHDHAAAAVERGAVALLVDRPLEVAVTQARVPQVRRALGPVAARFFGDPSHAMRVLGVTGTNGKTTTTYLLEAIAAAAGEPVGIIGTTGARIDGVEERIELTTPEAPQLQELLARMHRVAVDTVAMEVSSHALAYERVDGIRFATVCFTNLSQDHLDEHGTLEDYFEAKARLFTPEFAGTAAITLDDRWGIELAGRAQRAGLDVSTFGLDPRASVRGSVQQLDGDGSTIRLETDRGAAESVRLRLVGLFNVQNALAAASTALASGFLLDAVVAGLQTELVVPGRMERVTAGQPFTVLVDYAHTPGTGATRRGGPPAREWAPGGDRVRVRWRPGPDETGPDGIGRGGRGSCVLDLRQPAFRRPGRDRRRSRARPARARRALHGRARPTRRHPCCAGPGESERRGRHRGQRSRVGPGHRGCGHAVRRPGRRARGAGVARVDLTREEVATITGGHAVGPAAVARGFAFDSRTLAPGAGFVALRGDRDGHNFVADAFARGATLAVVERVPDAEDGPLVVVEDSYAALRALGVEARDRVGDAVVVGITGSAGKTSTKDLTSAALATAFTVHASAASFNNEIGLPITLLERADRRRRGRARDGRALRGEHHRALRDRPTDDRRHHPHRPRARRAPRGSRRHRGGQG